ncbi:MAG: hypothetical protein ACK5ML_06100 [Lachnospiraceae bacterium]
MNIKTDVSQNAAQLQTQKSSGFQSSTSIETSSNNVSSTNDNLAYAAEGVVYDSAESTGSYSKADRAVIIKQLAQESQNRINQFKELVESMFQKQGIKLTNADDMWNVLAKGEFTVTPEEKEAAKAAIAEDGYWGVNQTSERIFEFAKSLSGGDREKADMLLDAFKEGYKQATKAWGKELPEISKQTYDSVLKKFDEWKNEKSQESSTTAE